MIKQVLLLCSIIILSSLCSSTAIAGNSTSSIGVKMKITHANCTVNGGKGISGAYNLPLMNESGNVTDRVSATDVPLIIDCSKGVKPSALTISFTAATWFSECSERFGEYHNGKHCSPYPLET